MSFNEFLKWRFINPKDLKNKTIKKKEEGFFEQGDTIPIKKNYLLSSEL